MIAIIIVRILRDAWMVAPGLVPERGDRFRGGRIRQPVFPRALSARWFQTAKARQMPRWWLDQPESVSPP